MQRPKPPFRSTACFAAIAVVVGLGACSSATVPVGQERSSLTCQSGEQTCACATGSYCLGAGAQCLAPAAPCPGGDAAADAMTVNDAAMDGPAPGTCGPLQHVCACATGTYCLGAGALCIVPTAPCPDSDAGSIDAATPDGATMDATADGQAPGTCGPLQHVCACATGTYCLGAGALCIVPTAPCPTH